MNFLRRLPRRRSYFLLLQVAAGLITICIAAAMLYVAHETIQRAAVQQADNIANTLQRDLERDVDIVDLALRNAQTALSLFGNSNLSLDAQRSILFSGLKLAGHSSAMLVIDEHGQAVFDSGSQAPRQRPDYVARDWFTMHRDQAGDGLLMTLVPHNALNGEPVLVLSRRIDHADGTFAGVVGASLDPVMFEDIFRPLRLGADDNVIILTNDGRLIARRSQLAASFGADYSGAPAFRAIRAGAGPVFVAQSVIGKDRLFAQHQLRNVPLTVIVGLSVHDIYQTWWIEVATVGGVVAALLGAAFSLTTVLRAEFLRSATAEAEARQSESRYRMLADSTTDVITCLDLDFNRNYVSPSSRAALGYEPEELLGAPLAATVHPQDRSDTRARFQRVATGESETERATNRFRHKLGHYVWVESNLALVRDPATGKPASIVCAIRDITLRKQQSDQLLEANQELERLTRHIGKARDAAERANRAKSRFLASISHELRTPLNGILGYADLLRIEGGLSSSQAPRVEAMMTAGTHLLELINCVLDLTEIETGRIELRVTATDLRALVTACLEFVRPAAAAKRLSLAAQVEPAVPARVLLDATRLRQILLNLLGNAVKFTKAGSITLTVAIGQPSVLRFEVVDTGMGIAPGQRALLFQDFQRLGPDETKHIEGAGLGLALSAGLAALMDGSIGHEDNPPGGSIFYLTLPLAVAEQPGGEAPDVSAAGGSEAPAHVLVVDDVEVNRDIAASFLRAAGHHVVCAEDGAQAVAMARTTLFDVILMDVRMPQMDGLAASRRIRALGGAHSAVPIVAVTAQAFTQHVEECREAGMDHHLAKPFNQAALLAVVAKARSARPDSISGPPADGSADPSAAEAAGVFGNDLPILDQTLYEQTSRFVSANKLASSIAALIHSTTKLLQDLRAEPIDEAALAMAAHSLAGSAGLLGFHRLAAVGQRLEYAVDHQPNHLPQAVESLIAAAAVSLDEMRTLAARHAEAAGHDTPHARPQARPQARR